MLRDVKLIAEPWDADQRGLPGRPVPAAVVRVERQVPRRASRLLARPRRRRPRPASRLSGSSDLYADDDRLPFASVNFVTSHDGFTLRDLVSYESKHNEANGEDNRDGTDDNRSWNCGVEGETDDPDVQRSAIARRRTCWRPCCCRPACRCSTAGDERGRTQRGNNNAYCQDNEVSWVSLGPRTTSGATCTT